MSLLRADLGSWKVLVRAMKSQLLLAEGCKALPRAGMSPAWLRGPKVGAQRSLAMVSAFLLLPLQNRRKRFKLGQLNLS